MAFSMTQTRSVFGQRLASRPAARVSAAKARNVVVRAEVQLPDLPWPQDALEPKISKQTVEIHWGKHHRTYVTNLNNQIKGTDHENSSLDEIVVASWNNGSPSPMFNNAGQIWNHNFYWENISPSKTEPEGKLLDAINASFGSLDNFKKDFSAAGATQFGSGWAWLVKDGDKLTIEKTPNAETPFAQGKKPILTMDVWEHAYYLDTQNRRPDYIKTFVDELINWDVVAQRFESA